MPPQLPRLCHTLRTYNQAHLEPPAPVWIKSVINPSNFYCRTVSKSCAISVEFTTATLEYPSDNCNARCLTKLHRFLVSKGTAHDIEHHMNLHDFGVPRIWGELETLLLSHVYWLDRKWTRLGDPKWQAEVGVSARALVSVPSEPNAPLIHETNVNGDSHHPWCWRSLNGTFDLFFEVCLTPLYWYIGFWILWTSKTRVV